MFISKSLSTNPEGNLTIGGADTIVLAKSFGTPLYVMDENLMVENMRSYKDAIDAYYGGHGMVFYASKAFTCKEMARLVHREGLGMDVVSGGEMYTALSADFPAGRLCLHGNNKTLSELQMAIENGVGRIVADSGEELSIIDALAKTLKKRPKVLLRIKPGVEAHTHEFIMTGQNDSKFGVSLEDGEAFRVMQGTYRYENLEIAGVHSHIGSQIFDEKPFILAAQRLVEFIARVKKELGIKLYEMNLGGGFGIKYTQSDKPKPYKTYMKNLITGISSACERFEIEKPFLIVEPGRSIVGAAGITLYEAGAVKDIPNVRKYVSVDGGMADNPRYIMYEAEYEALLASKPYADKEETVTIAGRCCESGDIIIKDIKLPKIARGDIIAVLSTGAYNYSMSSNYNRLPRPAVVMVRDGVPRIVVKRETFESLVRNDL